jgi:hypothetical protein
MEKIYEHLDDALKEKLAKNTFFVSKWLVSEVAKRYQLSAEVVEKICRSYDLPIVGKGDDKFVLMYKPSIFDHPITKKKSLQINLFELATLNKEMRKHFIKDYQGKTWFWHRFVWRLPTFVFRILEFVYVMFASFFYSPRESIKIFKGKLATAKAYKKKNNLPPFYKTKVGSCFHESDIEKLALLIRDNYSSCLWKRGDILLVDNRKVMHAGMPGAGPRLVRAMICNPIEMKYSFLPEGMIDCKDRVSETVGFCMTHGESEIEYSRPSASLHTQQ